MDPIKNELILCTHSHNDTTDFRTFGNTIINECIIDYNYFSNLNYSSNFYQMYLKKKDHFEEIPVEIDNYMVSQTLSNFQASDEQKKLFKRFFLIFNRCQSSQLVFAQNVTLKVELDRNNTNGVSSAKSIYLKIYYDVESPANSKSINCTFVSDYYMNQDEIRKNIYGFLIFFSILVAFVVAVRIYVWRILNPEKLTNISGDEKGNYILYFLTNLIFITFKYTGIIFFFFFMGNNCILVYLL